MPPRFVTLAIVLFWLATAGWFFQHDLWPRLRPGQRPPFTIDLAQEVSGPMQPRFWQVHRNGITLGDAKTWVNHRADDDTYEMYTQLRFHNFSFSLVGGLLKAEIRKMDTMYRLTRDGQLHSVEAEGAVGLRGIPGHIGDTEARIHVTGAVENGTFAPQWRVESPLGNHDLPSESVEVSTTHSMLSPLQPWNRLLDVREDQRWQMQLFDPLTESLSASVGAFMPGAAAHKTQMLDAGVLQGTQDLGWNNRNVSCLVIEYRGENLLARTWIRHSDGLVLRQEAIRSEGTLQEERLVLERLPR